MGLVSFKSGGGVLNTGYRPSSITNLSISRSQKTAALTWTDPEDFTVDDTPCTWARTVLIRKSGSAPQSIHDGTEVAVIIERNKHAETPWVDGILEFDVTYYYAAYIVSTDGVVSDLSNIVSILIPMPKIMTVKIDLNDSNPATCGSFTDDATNMPVGKTNEAITTWQEFFGYRPCLFKKGNVVGYLNPNDYTKFEDGTSADITSGDAGDVMIEFPRRGIKISEVGKIITVSMTDDPNDPEFTYYAHTRGDDEREYFYLGAYSGYIYANKLRSLSSKSIDSSTVGFSLSNFRNYAHTNGSGYELMTWFQLVFIQTMYLLQFKGNLDSQTTVGSGHCIRSHRTGTKDTKGLFDGDEWTNNYIKIFGLEDLWGYYSTLLDGIYTYEDGTIWLAIDNFNNTHSGYIEQKDTAIEGYGYMSDVIGTSELAFYPSEINGSWSTYFCDECDCYYLNGNNCCSMGGIGGYSSNPQYNRPGLFSLNIGDNNPTSSEAYTVARLAFY